MAVLNRKRTLLQISFATAAVGWSHQPLPFARTIIPPSSRPQATTRSISNGYHYHSTAIHVRAAAACADGPSTSNEGGADGEQYNMQARVEVYDNAFRPVACQVLHALAAVHSSDHSSDGATALYVRPPFNSTALTPLEHAIDSALVAMNDTSGRTVEYWARDEHMNIDAHVDIDENALEREEQQRLWGVRLVHPGQGQGDDDDNDSIKLRYPQMAHVLYLEVKKGLVGPTVVFPGKRIGWGLDQQQSDESTAKAAMADVDVDVVTIPAVQGRILRFPGSTMHAVPCPADRWLMTEEEEWTLRSEEEEDCEEDDYDDDDEHDCDYDDDDDGDDDEEYQVERSVLLFNTWSDDGGPPRGVQTGYATAVAGSTGDERRLIEEWTEGYGVGANLIHCNPASEWRRKKYTTDSMILPPKSQGGDGDANTARVHLMGEENRRLFVQKVARINVPETQMPHLVDALHEEIKVTHLRLKEKRP